MSLLLARPALSFLWVTWGYWIFLSSSQISKYDTHELFPPVHPPSAGCLAKAALGKGTMWSGLPWWLSGKESACKAGDVGSVPGLARSPGEGKGNPLQYSCLGNPWTEEPGRLQSMESQRVRCDLATKQQQEYHVAHPLPMQTQESPPALPAAHLPLWAVLLVELLRHQLFFLILRSPLVMLSWHASFCWCYLWFGGGHPLFVQSQSPLPFHPFILSCSLNAYTVCQALFQPWGCNSEYNRQKSLGLRFSCKDWPTFQLCFYSSKAAIGNA